MSALTLSTLIPLVTQPVGALAILTLIVVVHESGHFLAAKQLGIAVDEFSIGFGPKLWGFRRPIQSANIDDDDDNDISTNDDDNDTGRVEEFNVRALPLGGYVRFPPNYNATLAQELDRADQDAFVDFIQSRPLSVSEQLINALTLGVWTDKLWNDEKKQRSVERLAQTAARDASLSLWTQWWWDRRGRGRGQSTAGTTTTTNVNTNYDQQEIEYYDDPNLLQNRPWPHRALVLSGGVLFNFLLAFALCWGQVALGPGIPVPAFAPGVVVTGLTRPDAPARGLLGPGDVILALNGVPMFGSSTTSTTNAVPPPQTPSSTTTTTTTAADAMRAVDTVIAQIRAVSPGESIAFTVLHPNDSRPQVVRIQPTRNGGGATTLSTTTPMTVGVSLGPNFSSMTVLQSKNPLEAANLARQYVSSVTMDTANGLAAFGKSLVVGTKSGAAGGGGSSSGSQVSGPVGLLKTGSDVVGTGDWTTVVLFTVALSVNLGVINSIPLPALDGGQLVFVLSEAVTGRKVNQRFQEQVTGVTVLFLVLLSVSTLVSDVTNLVR